MTVYVVVYCLRVNTVRQCNVYQNIVCNISTAEYNYVSTAYIASTEQHALH